ncbi:nicotinate-nucleotide diphosphorylase (carboxylating) [Coemansia brasiliensis]|uniref:Nicotinate-nucleotide pyrophosphorylase [carboxylating] n=1 Tax=Coemansia brasiliensis TaxID=2650707 RepID=A0A9W8I4L8_9FUNG|nr:nicotinate-nucleotide diphosphorylase (carboxylating) [Coemansia brasiliensis]
MSRLASLLPTTFGQTIDAWLAEDIPSFDYGGYVVGDDIKIATLVTWNFEEGAEIIPNDRKVQVAVVQGPARLILMGERLALNILARCSGVASRARRLRNIADSCGFQGIVAGTRKTTPGFRLIEKYGMQVGGADTHRMDLSSMVMLKDNHIWATGSITKAVEQARMVAGFSTKIEVECQSEAEAMEAIDAGADIVMLDNFKPDELELAAANIKASCLGAKRQVPIEASGGITEDNAAEYMVPSIDIISFGSMTQSVPHVDFSLKIAH